MSQIQNESSSGKFQQQNWPHIKWYQNKRIEKAQKMLLGPRTSEEMDGTLPRFANFVIQSRGPGRGSYYTPGLDVGWFFGPWAYITSKSSYQDFSNEVLKNFWVHWNLFIKLLKHGHFWINFRFWLIWVEFRKNKALSSLNLLQRLEKYQVGSCPQLLYA